MAPIATVEPYDWEAAEALATPYTAARTLQLIGNTDARFWAEVFTEVRQEHPGIIEEDTMLGWFANAIMAGVDSRPTLMSLAYECYSTAVEKGFWEPVDSAYLEEAMHIFHGVGVASAELEFLRKRVAPGPPFNMAELVTAPPKIQTLGLKLLLIISEAAEAFEALLHEPEKEGEEVADILIRLLDYAAVRNIDLDEIVRAKMTKNAGRPYKHNCNF